MERIIKFEVSRDDNKEIIGYERIGERGQWEHIRLNRDEWLLGAITDGQEYSKFIRRQFVGLEDDNKNEIYENDPIHCWGGTEWNGMFEYDYHGVCKFLNGSFVIVTESNVCIDFGSIEYVVNEAK